MKFALVNVVVNLAAGIGMFHLIGVPGLAVGTSAGAWANVLLMFISLHRRGMWHLSARSASALTKILVCGALMGGFLAVCSHLRPQIEAAIGTLVPVLHKEIAIVGVCFAGLFVYIACLFVTGAVRPAELKAALRRG